jgi:DNA polymerase-3 subunit beta
VKFRSERDSLVEALATAGRAVGGRGSSASAVLSGLLLSCEGNHLAVTGTDLDLTIRFDLEIIGIEDGSCVVPARLVADIVRSLEPGAVTVESTEDKVEISAARSRFGLRSYPVVEFPPMQPPSEPGTHLAAPVLAEGLRQAVPCSPVCS